MQRFDPALVKQDFVARHVEESGGRRDLPGHPCSGSEPDQVIHGHPNVVPIPAGDCATSRSANGTWSIADEIRGSIVCYVDGTTGDAVLDWTYDGDGLLVRAHNARGDSAALYRFFEKHARFMTP